MKPVTQKNQKNKIMMKITALLTILCISALNGMEAETTFAPEFPQDIKAIILSYLIGTNKNLKDIITNIKATSSINKQWYATVNDLKLFTTLAHMLADKFNTTTSVVAHRFNMPITKKYIELGKELIGNPGIDKAIQLIESGADANFYHYSNPLFNAIRHQNLELVKLLIRSGAKPRISAADTLSTAKRQIEKYPSNEDAKTIKQLTEDAFFCKKTMKTIA